jgi:hypothetical protein
VFAENGVLYGNTYIYASARGSTRFSCNATAFTLNQSKLNPVDPQYVLQYKEMHFEFDGQPSNQEMYSNKSQVLLAIRSLAENSSNTLGIDNVNYLENASSLKYLEPIFIDIALDQTIEMDSSLGKSLSLGLNTNLGPVDIDYNRTRKTSTVYWSAAKHAYWSSNLMPPPQYHVFTNAIVHIELANLPSNSELQRTELHELEVYLTRNVPQDRVALKPSPDPVFREDFESNVSGWISSDRTRPPSGVHAWTSSSYSLNIPSTKINLMRVPVTKNSGTSIGFWLWVRENRDFEKGLWLLDLQTSTVGNEFFKVGFDLEKRNSLRLHVRFKIAMNGY